MKKAAIVIAVLCCLPRLLLGSDPDLRTELNASYAHKGLFLRHPVRQNSQHYDSDGKLVSSGDEGPWTLYGPVEVTRVDLTNDKLRIIGNRLIYAYDPKLHEFAATRQKHPTEVKIEIALGAPLSTLEETNAIISRVFAKNPAEIVASLPDFWRLYFQKRPETLPSAESNVSSTAGNNTGSSGPSEKGLAPARIGMKGVKPPQPIYTPEPEFSEFAKTAGIQGVCVLSAIIGVDGRTHDIHIVRPLGAGLDERAIDAVRNWKFKPATMGGQPVPMQLGLEIAFNLFK